MDEENPIVYKGIQLQTKDFPDGSAVFVNKTSGMRTLQALQELRSQPHLCDVKFQMEGGGEVLAHRCILVLHSDYFRSMFSENFREGRSWCSVLQPSPELVDQAAAEALLDFMYTGQLKVTGDTVQGLIMAAEHWQMQEVKKACLDYMEQHIDTHNCLGILMFSQQYSSEQLNLSSQQLVKLRFPMVSQTEEFLSLPSATLAEILSLDQLTLDSEGEDVILRALFRWIEFDPQHRLSELPTLLKTVRLNQTSLDCRKELLDSNQLIQDNEELTELIKGLLSEERQGRTPQASLYVMGGFSDLNKGPARLHLRGVERLDMVTQKWTPSADLPLSCRIMTFTIHGRLFCYTSQPVQPGRESLRMKATESGIFEYRFLQDVWVDAKSSLPPEALQRLEVCSDADGALAVCSRTNTIYMISHSEFSSISLDLEDGDVCCRKVQQLPHPGELLSTRQRSHAAVVVEGKLYVLGGDRRVENSNLPDPTSSVLVFDPQRQVWVQRANMLTPRVKLAAVQLDGKIYASGGFHVNRLSSMERYDPVTDTWSSVQPMSKSRSHHQLVVFNDHIWALGGKSYVENDRGTWKVASLCEVYDPHTDTWKQGPDMRTPRQGFAAAVI